MTEQERRALQMIADVVAPGVMTAVVSGMSVVLGIRTLRQLGWSDRRIHRATTQIMKQS